MSKQYVRLMPYDQRTGALCRRFMVGGCLFKEGQWYELESAWAAKLAPLRQATNAPVFQIMSAEEYGSTVRAELAAAYMRGGVSLAMAGALAPPTAGAPPKKGARKSAFDGMRADEASLVGATSGVITTRDLPSADTEPPAAPDDDADDAADDDDADDGEEVDLDTIRSKKAALALAEKFGVRLDGDSKLSEMKDVLARELFEDE